jgi:ribosome-associated protein
MNIKTDKKILIDTIITGIENVKGEEIVVMDLTEIENAITEYFIICTANSTTQANAISSSVERLVRNEIKERPWHVEGVGNNQWILLDYVSVVVHVFLKETREYYDIENLWGDAKITKIETINNN